MGHHLSMGPVANNFAMHFADSNLRAIANSDIAPEAVQAFNDIMRAKHPDFPGIENPSESFLAMKEDSKMRKYFNDRMKKPTITEPLGLPNGLDIQWSITEPELRNMEIAMSGHSVGRLKPGAELIEGADHGTYTHGIQGEALGHAPELSPFEIAYPDADMYLRSVYKPSELSGTINMTAPHQKVDAQYLDQLNDYYKRLREIRGFAKGGKVGRAASILSELQKAYDEAKAIETVKAVAPTIITPTRGKIKDIMENVRNSRGNYAARRVEQAADLVPNLEHQYTQNALEREFKAENPQALMVLNPKDFEQFAHPLASELTKRTSNYGKYNVPAEMGYNDYIEHLANIANDSGFSDVPYLQLDEDEVGNLIIGGHEGRHRNRALTNLGDESTLISLNPSNSLTSSEARRYKEDYVNALNARFGADRKITPEYRAHDDAKRSPIAIPEFFADGGKVDLDKEFLKADTFDKGGSAIGKNIVSPIATTTGEILGNKTVSELYDEIKRANPRMPLDVIANTVSGILGIPGDVASTMTSKAKPTVGKNVVGMIPTTEDIKGATTKAGITSGEEYPLIETAALGINPRSAIKGIKALKNLPVGLSIKDVSPKSVEFTSSLAKAVNSHKMESMPGPQWSAWINSNASKSAKKEAEATGLHEWLKTQPKATKYDIEEHIGENLPKVKVTEKGAPLKLTHAEQVELSDLGQRHSNYLHTVGDELSEEDLNKYIRLANIDEKATPANLRSQAEALERIARKEQKEGYSLNAHVSFGRAEHYKNRADALEANPIQYGGSKYEKYTLPGGENYKETMLSLPKTEKYLDKKGLSVMQREDFETYAVYDKDLNQVSPTFKNLDDARNWAMSPKVLGDNFEVPTAHKYNDPDTDVNRIAHLRTKDRPTLDDKKALFLEELQSDWAQQGRDRGFRQDIPKLTDAEERRFQELLQDGRRNLEGDKLAEFESLIAKRDAHASNSSIPSGPYVTDTKDWTALGLKHALKQAVEGEHDYVTWATGAQNAEHYNLSKYVNEIGHEKNPDGTYNIYAHGKDGEQVLLEDDIPLSRVEELVGKDMAKKIEAQEGEGKAPTYQLITKNTKPFPRQAELDDIKARLQAFRDAGDREGYGQLIGEHTDLMGEKNRFDDAMNMRNSPINFDTEAKAHEFAAMHNLAPEAYQVNPVNLGYRNWKKISGLDLDIGEQSKGMKKYYDELVPSAMNDVMKQIGSSERVKPVAIKIGNEAPEIEPIMDGSYSVHVGDDTQYFETEQQAKRFVDSLSGNIPLTMSADDLLRAHGPQLRTNQRNYLQDYSTRWDAAEEAGHDIAPLIDEYQNWVDKQSFNVPGVSQHLGIEITPELREKILNEGLPHFQEGGQLNARTVKRDKIKPIDLETAFKLSKFKE
jgi:hypothetical protein